MANDLFSALRTYINKLSSGEKTPQEMAAALNIWARESGEAIKQRVEEEVARSVKKMGFAKQEELDRLAREVEALKSRLVVNSTRSATQAKSKSTAASTKGAKSKNSPSKTKASTTSTKKSTKSSASAKANANPKKRAK